MEPTKLLIVEDEPYIRHGIRYTIPWQEHDIEVIGEAASGKEALEFCRCQAPDIVLTDIKMPRMNGLDLAKILSEQMPLIKVIILTAYSEPDFFCEAIESRVNSFIMKDANSDQILAAVLKAKKQLLIERAELETTHRLQNIYNENQNDLIELTFRQFLSGELSCPQFETKIQDLDFSLMKDRPAMIAAELSVRHITELKTRLYILLTRCEPFIFTDHEKYLVIILRTQPPSVDGAQMVAVTELLGNYVMGNHIVYAGEIQHTADLPGLYRRMLEAMRICFWNEDISYLTLSPDTLPYVPAHNKIEESEKETMASLLSEDAADSSAVVRRHFALLESGCVPRDCFLSSMERIFIMAAARYPENGQRTFIPDMLKEIKHPGEVTVLYDRLFPVPAKDETDNRLLSRALEYINQNYAAPIRLADIAGLVYLSEGYLSRIFKDKTGCSFKDYLNKTRIEKAKQLVSESDLKYYEIAEMVGYGNYKYFAQYFQKHCGCSAKEYRMKFGK